MQWPPCYYDDWTPPMDYYQPCGNNINPAQAPPQQPDQDYWPGQIFPDCCTYECAPECFPGPEWGIFPFFLQVNIFVNNSFTGGVAISIPANFYIQKMAIHQYLEIKIVFGFVSDSCYAT